MKKRSLIIFVALALVPLILLAQISSPGSYSSVIMTFLRSTTAAAARSAIGAANSGSGGELTNAVIYGSTSGSWTFGSTGNLNSSSAATLGVGTSSPDKALDVNSATGACFQMTYNDSNGSAANKVTFDVSSGGNLTIAPSGNNTTFQGSVAIGATQSFAWSARSSILSPSDGVIRLNNAATTDFSRLQFGGTTSSFPSLKRSSTTLAVRLADDSADAPITASNGTFSGIVASTANSGTLAAAATTLAITSNVRTVTGDAGGNTIATITGGVSGQLLTLIFADSLVTITDDATGTVNTVNLSAAFTSTSNDTLTLVFNGTSWREVSRSVN